MAEIHFTPSPYRVTEATTQPLDQAIEVTGYSGLDAIAGLVGIEGTTSGVSIEIITSMQKESEDGWVTLLTFPAGNLDTLADFDRQSTTTGLLKYVRWKVTGIGSATSITFTLAGVLRPER